MVHGIIYFALLAIIIATNTYHYKVERKQNAEIDWWREECVKNENELNALKEKQTKRKTIKK
jgi:hypothetical protein